ncbi:MAG: SDR family NAD(P)-dependent oxidoreductase [Pseudomonadales bacterium]
MKVNVALVTGGASGMGRLAALDLANKGAKVAIVDMNEENLAATAAESNNITAYRCDVSDLDAVRLLVDKVQTELGEIDRLTQCAAIMPGDSIRGMSAELTNKQMLINYCGTVNMVKTVMEGMEQRGRGQIAVFGSMAGSVLTHGLGGYSATKAATNVWMEVLAEEQRDSPVHYLLVCPPMVNTPLVDQALEKGPGSIKGAVKDKRMSEPQDIVDAVEAVLAKGKSGKNWRVCPQSAGTMMFLRRLAPGLMWKMMRKANGS